jgi:hypothetical protein
MSNKGFILLDRKIADHRVFKSDPECRVFDIEGLDDDEKPRTELLEHITTNSNH